MAVSWIKNKYAVGHTYKNQKSPAGMNNKKKHKGKALPQKVIGRKVLLVDMSGIPKYCPTTGAKLPNNGMVVELEGKYYANYEAAFRASN